MTALALAVPAHLFAPTQEAATRFLEFFTGQVANANTRKAYLNATRRFAAWCAEKGIDSLEGVQPLHVAVFIRELEGEMAAPTVKQNLAALRMLFDWLVTGHILQTNPAHAVRGPKHSVKRGKTPVLTPEETRTLLDSIETTTLAGLRDRALIAAMVYTFGRVNAVLSLRVKDYFVQGRRGWLRLREKGGKEHDVPCHHNLERYLDEYIAAGGVVDGPLFRTLERPSGKLSDRPLWQQDAYRMIQRRATAAGLATRIGNHTFRATGITAYLKNGGKLEIAQAMAGHESPRTTKLYDRRNDDISLDEVERIMI